MSRSEYQEKLSELLNEPYRKNTPDIYGKLEQCGGSQERAIKNAQRLFSGFSDQHIPPSQSNPCTTMYMLVEELNKFTSIETIRII